MRRCPCCTIIARKRLVLQLQADISSEVPSTELVPCSLLQRLNLKLQFTNQREVGFIQGSSREGPKPLLRGLLPSWGCPAHSLGTPSLQLWLCPVVCSFWEFLKVYIWFLGIF